MKKVMRGLALAIWASFGAAILAQPVLGADLGGTCCSDLEERISELEATVAKRGNRKVAVTITGQVSRSIMWIDGGDPIIGDNPNSETRLRIHGSAKLMDNVTAGYVLEFGAESDEPSIRQNYVYLRGLLGTVSLGHQSTATDGISEVSLANTNVANKPAALFGPLLDGSRADVVKLESATIAGFTAAVSYGGDDVWDMALRYSQEFGVIRVAAGIGYAEDPLVGPRTSGSVSVMHVPTGVFLNGVASRSDDLDADLMYFTGGIERNWLGFGASTLFAEGGKLDAIGTSGDGWGLGAVQAFDAAAMDVFLAYRSVDDSDIVHGGMRVQF